MAAAKGVGCGFGFGEIVDGERGEDGELVPVGRDPGDDGEKLLVEGLDGLGWEEVGAGAGAEDGVEDDGRGRLTPVRLTPARGISVGLIPCRLAEFREKSRYSGGDFGGAEHSDLDARGGEVDAEVVEGAAEEGWGDGLELGDAQGGLHRKCCDRTGSEEAMGGEGLEIGGNAGTAGRIVAGDGQECADAGGWTRGKSGHGGQPSDEKTLSYLKGNCNLKNEISAFDLFDLGY